MGTRSNIAIKNDDGSYDVIYCHWDGFFSSNGVMLFTKYRDEKIARELINGGDMSSLGEEIVETVYYSGKGEDWEDVKPANYTVKNEEELCQEEYLYLWKDGGWWGFSEHDDEPIRELLIVLSDDKESLPMISSFLDEESAA
jgi:hypothetical protein